MIEEMEEINKTPTVDEMLELCRKLLKKCAELDKMFANDNPFI